MPPRSSRVPARRSTWIVFSLAVLVALAFAAAARAQIEVEIKLSRRTYILFEPLVATVTVTNNAGRDITLEDGGNTPWFNVEVSTLDGGAVPPFETDYKLHPLTVPNGQSLRRKIDLAPLFPIRDMGTHRLRAAIYFAEADRYYYSNYASFDLTDGKTIWRQNVGVPGSAPGEAGDVRQVSLLTHSLPDRMLLYVRVRDENGSNIYTTQSLGRLVITGREPQEMFDRQNTLHVLHEALPGTYFYSVVSLNGDQERQQVYTRAGSNRPTLYKSDNGTVEVRGGVVQAAPAALPAGQKPAKLSDRPAGLPRGAPKSPDGF